MAVTDLVTGTVTRVGALAQNALEVARFGGLETGEAETPYAVVDTSPVHRLRRYLTDADEKDAGPPVLLVPPMMLAAEVYDVSPSSSAVASLHGHGIDPWVVDFGAPEREEGGLERDLADHVLAVSDAVDRVREQTGRDVHLAGYSQGGMFCYQTAAYRRSAGIASVIGFGSPVDTRGVLPYGLPEELVARVAGIVAERTLGRAAVPAWVSRNGFRLLDPVKAARQQLDFLLALHDREALLPRERQRRFLQADGWVAWPGPALADFMRQFVVHNRMLQGGFTIEDRLVTLADIRCPVLVFIGEVDEIAPPASVRPIARAAPRAEVYERTLRAGHFGLVVGGRAREETWPAVRDWVAHVDAGKRLPAEIRLADPEAVDQRRAPLGVRAGFGLGLATEVGVGAARSLLSAGGQTLSGLRELAGEGLVALPRLARLESVRPRTRISLGLLLDEHAERAPDSVLFLFEDRAHTQATAKHRIDSVVRGFISLGVRQGEHVGVLMDMRPSALTAVAALNRLGAVAVILRPDGTVETEAELGQIARLVTDPENRELAQRAGVPVLVLGGGAQPRDLGDESIDMERIDPEDVELPGWYQPNPGRARDLAFVLFTGEGERTRVNRITNRRWALSAFGTASSAHLGDGDTVYTVTPIHHPSALLTSLGGAIAGGSRIALARRFDPETFWEETRRYGVTVASYTWTMLRALADAPPDPAEQHHPIRLFVGSGMPAGLWRRVTERFAPARVLEFYASPQSEAILVNLSGEVPLAGGRPLPGSAEVRLAGWDPVTGQLRTEGNGFASACEVGDAGVLLARVPEVDTGGGDAPLRGVFRRGDAWANTGDLFRCDEDGMLWLLDAVASLVHTEDGRVAPSYARLALEELDAVDVAVAFGIPARKRGVDKLAAAVVRRKGHKIAAKDLTAAVAVLAPKHRPDEILVVPDLPVTTWFRPRVGELRTRLIERDLRKTDQRFTWDRGRESYRRAPASR